MKKVFFVSLLLMGIFVMCIAEVVSAQTIDGCACYQCTAKYMCGEELLYEWDDSVELCLDGDGYANIWGFSPWGCDLGGRSLFASNKNFIGLGGSQWGGESGCSAEIRGRSMTVDLYHINNCMTQFRCVQGGECPPNI
jgi:hypothetical protein